MKILGFNRDQEKKNTKMIKKKKFKSRYFKSLRSSTLLIFGPPAFIPTEPGSVYFTGFKFKQ